MFPHDPYLARGIEYLLALGFLALFAGFWSFAMGGLAAPVAHARRAIASTLADWFHVPERVMFHPGHAWARLEAPGIVAVGLDDFAQRLVGPLAAVSLPAPGSAVEQGTPGWSLEVDNRHIDMLSPVSGRVVAINDEVLLNPHAANDDPYGRGWLMKVQVPRLASNAKQLLSGGAARHWMASVCEELSAALSPQLGAFAQDGGTPIQGFARGIDGAHWESVARRFLLS